MLSAAESTPVLPHNENIPVYRLLTAEENKRSGKVRPVGGEEFRKSKGRIYVSVIFRGKRICNSFGTSAQSYARARRWQVFFRNLKLRERVFWLYSPHIRHYPDRFVVVGYRRDQNWGKRRTRKTLWFTPETMAKTWERACSLFYEFSRYDPARDKNAVIKDFGGWMPQPFESLESVLARANQTLSETIGSPLA